MNFSRGCTNLRFSHNFSGGINQENKISGVEGFCLNFSMGYKFFFTPWYGQKMNGLIISTLCHFFEVTCQVNGKLFNYDYI